MKTGTAGKTIDNPMKQLLIVAGEPSADAYAARLIEELHHLDTAAELQVCGLGGPGMERAGAHLLHDYRKLAHIGPWEAIFHLPQYLRVFQDLLRWAETHRPPVAVLLDFPDFNLRLARRLKLLGIKVFYYISPQVWAWRPGRVKEISRWVDRMFVIFPFEVDFYKRHGVDVQFIGHPLLENADKGPRKGVLRRMLRIPKNVPLVTLFPGSRSKEVRRILPPMLNACTLIAGQRTCHFAIVKAPNLDEDLLQHVWQETAHHNPQLSEESLPISLVDVDPEEALADSDAAMVKSGTSTLQAALAGTPFVMIYKLSWPSWMVARLMVRSPFACIVNLIAGKEVVPEFLQRDAQAEEIAAEILHLLDSPAARESMRDEFQAIRARLGTHQPSALLASILATELELKKNPRLWHFPSQPISQFIH